MKLTTVKHNLRSCFNLLFFRQRVCVCVFALRTRGLQITNGVLLKAWFVNLLLIFGTWSELFHRNNDINRIKPKLISWK